MCASAAAGWKSSASIGRGRPVRLRLVIVLLLAALPAVAQRFYTYVGDITADSVLLAWGAAEGEGNTIGRGSAPYGVAAVRIDDREITVEDRNWTRVSGLEPDREYAYAVILNGKQIGEGSVRTYPVKADRLTFIVIGDFGTGKQPQYQLAAVMAREVANRRQTGNPVRFVLTTGDNVYGKIFYRTATGDKDNRWKATFFEPYEPVLRHIPFYMTLGNHDGNESEKRGDLAVQLDNFFFPGDRPSRWYTFSYGGLADFFALDTTRNSAEGPKRAAYEAGGEQYRWLGEALAKSASPWKIAYFHHPPFSAGPRHKGSREELGHILDLLEQHGVQVAFSGHEHNFQVVRRNDQTGRIQYVITGSGGQLRSGDISRQDMIDENIAGWAKQRQFCLVEIDGSRLTITPVSTEPVRVIDPDGKPLPMPVVVER